MPSALCIHHGPSLSSSSLSSLKKTTLSLSLSFTNGGLLGSLCVFVCLVGLDALFKSRWSVANVEEIYLLFLQEAPLTIRHGWIDTQPKAKPTHIHLYAHG